MRLTLAGCCVSWLSCLCSPSFAAPDNLADAVAHQTADVLYSGGAIHPMEPVGACGPEHRGVATKGDEILWVGCLDHMPHGTAGPHTRHVDLQGRSLLPGFVDAHSHMFGNAADQADFENRQALVLRNGITSQGELFVNHTILDHLTSYLDAGVMKVRTSAYLRWNNACGDVLDEWWAAYQPIHDPKRQLRMPGLKIFTDGGVCNDAAITFSYPDGTFGDLYLNAQQLIPMLEEAQHLGWQVAMHTIGDASRDEVLKALEHDAHGHGHGHHGGPPVRVEHDVIIRPEQVRRYGEVGAVPVVFGAVHTCTEGSTDPNVSWRGIMGPSRYEWYRPLRDLIEENPHLPVAWCLDLDGTVDDGSDRPMHEGETVASIYGLVTRRQVDTDGTLCEPPADMLAQSITIHQALWMMTRDAARALGTDSVVGSLKHGKYADFVILSQDPEAVDPDALKDLAVSATVLGGEPVYCAPGSEDLCVP
jgi:predicted amidohydrolase YtcJ